MSWSVRFAHFFFIKCILFCCLLLFHHTVSVFLWIKLLLSSKRFRYRYLPSSCQKRVWTKLGGSVLYLKLLTTLMSDITLKCNVCETDFGDRSNSGQQAGLPVVGKTVVHYLCGNINCLRQMKHQFDATLCRFYFCKVTLHVSGTSTHHQEYLKLVQRPLVHVLSL